MIEVNEIIMCIVERVANAMVFVKTEAGEEGNIILSEVAAGRIRNLRKYVFPKKRILCKVLSISNNKIDFSLRRVTKKEQKEFKEEQKEKKRIERILKKILKEKTEDFFEKTEGENLLDFFERAKQNSKDLEKIIGKENTEKILTILSSQKKEKRILKRRFFLKSSKSDGVTLIKKILLKIKDGKIKYLSAGQYSLKVESEDIKKADHKSREILENIKKESKKLGMDFSIKEK